jgi:outer membrane protein assembly factor BamD (BamD/ComL family)
VEQRLALNKAEIAGLFYATIGLADSARGWYLRVLREHPNSPFGPRAKYVLAQIYSQDSSIAHTTVDSLYRDIIDRHPDSEFADEARRLLGLPKHRKLMDEADLLYLRGEQLASDGQRMAAIDTFASVVRRYPSSRIASKAQYAIGWLYEQMNTQPDSTVAQYRKLVSLYPSSEYAERVRPKLAYLDIQKQGGTSAKDSLASDQKKKESENLQEQVPQKKRDRLRPDDIDDVPQVPRKEPAKDIEDKGKPQ